MYRICECKSLSSEKHFIEQVVCTTGESRQNGVPHAVSDYEMIELRRLRQLRRQPHAIGATYVRVLPHTRKQRERSSYDAANDPRK